jgi:hypothetical protein
MRSISNKGCRERTHTLCSTRVFRKSFRLWDIVEKNIVEPERPDDNIIRRMRCAYWITKATHTQRIRNTSCFSAATLFMQTRLSVRLYVHCLSSVWCCLSVYSEIFWKGLNVTFSAKYYLTLDRHHKITLQFTFNHLKTDVYVNYV